MIYKEEKCMLNMKKGDSVMLCGFTGMKLGVFEVTAATKSSITIEKADGTELVFSRKTGKQTNVAEGKERYANYITEDDGSYVNPLEKARKTSGKKSSKKKAADEDEDEKPVKKGKKKPAKKAPKKVEEPDEDEDDEYEDDEEDEE